MSKEITTILLPVILPFLIAFAVSALSGRRLIPFLRKVKAGQTERDDGPQSHLSKSGTPNMGGLMILLGFTIAILFASVHAPQVLPVWFLIPVHCR